MWNEGIDLLSLFDFNIRIPNKHLWVSFHSFNLTPLNQTTPYIYVNLILDKWTKKKRLEPGREKETPKPKTSEKNFIIIYNPKTYYYLSVSSVIFYLHITYDLLHLLKHQFFFQQAIE